MKKLSIAKKKLANRLFERFVFLHESEGEKIAMEYFNSLSDNQVTIIFEQAANIPRSDFEQDVYDFSQNVKNKLKSNIEREGAWNTVKKTGKFVGRTVWDTLKSTAHGLRKNTAGELADLLPITGSLKAIKDYNTNQRQVTDPVTGKTSTVGQRWEYDPDTGEGKYVDYGATRRNFDIALGLVGGGAFAKKIGKGLTTTGKAISNEIAPKVGQETILHSAARQKLGLKNAPEPTPTPSILKTNAKRNMSQSGPAPSPNLKTAETPEILKSKPSKNIPTKTPLNMTTGEKIATGLIAGTGAAAFAATSDNKVGQKPEDNKPATTPHPQQQPQVQKQPDASNASNSSNIPKPPTDNKLPEIEVKQKTTPQPSGSYRPTVSPPQRGVNTGGFGRTAPANLSPGELTRQKLAGLREQTTMSNNKLINLIKHLVTEANHSSRYRRQRKNLSVIGVKKPDKLPQLAEAIKKIMKQKAGRTDTGEIANKVNLEPALNEPTKVPHPMGSKPQ